VYDHVLLNKVPLSRLRIGLGFVGIIQIIYILKSVANITLN